LCLRGIRCSRIVDGMKYLSLLSVGLLFFVGACDTVREVSSDMGDAIGVATPTLDRSSERLISQGACPKVEIVEDLSLVYDFMMGAEKTPQNLISSAKINEAHAMCDYGLQSITMDTKIQFLSQMGGSSRGRTSFDYPFFVAVTVDNGEILAKEIFPKSVEHSDAHPTKPYAQDVRQIIPLKDGYDGSRYKVLVGFQVNSEQLAFNRELLRLKAQAEKDAAQAALQDKAKAAIGGIPVPDTPTVQVESAPVKLYEGIPVVKPKVVSKP